MDWRQPGADILCNPDKKSARDYLVDLLHYAAEIEHGLMIQYLYAAYSLCLPVGRKHLMNRVATWKDFILVIAKEEMGHLLTVQNVLAVLGEDLWLTRPDFPWDRTLNPFPFELRRLSKETLACFVWAEMKHPFDERELRDRNPKYERFVHEDLPEIKKVNDPSRTGVGQLYEKILALLRSSELSDSTFQAVTYTGQASWDDWGRHYRQAPSLPGRTTRPAGASKNEVIVRQIASRSEAIDAVTDIAEQGEMANLKSRLPIEASHFDRFVDVYEQFAKHKGQLCVLRLATNPTLDNGRGERIVSCESRLWARLFDLRYHMLLLYLMHTFQLARPDHRLRDVRGIVMHKAFGEMYNLKAIAGVLVQLPMADDGTDTRAGPPFTMPKDLRLPAVIRDCWQLHRQNLDRAMTLSGRLLERSGESSNAGRRVDYLRALRASDQQTIEWVDRVIAGAALWAE